MLVLSNDFLAWVFINQLYAFTINEMKFLNVKECKKFVNLAVKRTAKYLKENNLKGATLGISGGIDSAGKGLSCGAGI